MQITNDVLSISSDETLKWIEWFAVMNKNAGMDQEVVDSFSEGLKIFMKTSSAFLEHMNNTAKIECPKCHGRGHNNLILLGEKNPGPCKNCDGTGRILTGKAE